MCRQLGNYQPSICSFKDFSFANEGRLVGLPGTGDCGVIAGKCMLKLQREPLLCKLQFQLDLIN